MVYCIVEGQTDALILSMIFSRIEGLTVKMIVSDGFPSMPAVARTIMSRMDRRDKTMIVCDQDNFQRGGYGRDMFGFLLRGAINNPSFKLFTFNPNIDHLIAKPSDDRGWKRNFEEIEKRVNENIEAILNDETIKKIIDFAH
jgi:hypothetical protein